MKKWMHLIWVTALFLTVLLPHTALAKSSAAGELTVDGTDVKVALHIPDGELESITTLQIKLSVTVRSGALKHDPIFEFADTLKSSVKDAEISKEESGGYIVDIILSGTREQDIFASGAQADIGTLFLNPKKANEFSAEVNITGENSEDAEAPASIKYLDAGSTSAMTMPLPDTAAAYVPSGTGPEDTPPATTAPKPSSSVKVGSVAKLKASASTTSVKLTWKKTSGASGYQVQCYDFARKKYVQIGTVKKSKAAYTDKKLSTGTKCIYRVRAYRKVSGKTYYGKYASVRVITKPLAVTDLTAQRTSTAGTRSTAKILFTTYKGATAYNIYKYNTANKKYALTYRITHSKLYQYNTRKKTWTYLRKISFEKGRLCCKLTNLNLKKEKIQKYKIRTVISKNKYPTQYSSYTKVVKIK